jgi:hypothetical protein
MQTLKTDKLRAAFISVAEASPPKEAPRDYTIAEVITPLLDLISEMRSATTVGPDGLTRAKTPYAWGEILMLLNEALTTMEVSGQLKCNAASLQKTYYRLKARPASLAGLPAPKQQSDTAPAANSGVQVGGGTGTSAGLPIPGTPASAGAVEELIRTCGEDHEEESGAHLVS